MKKRFPYLIGLLALIAMLVLAFVSNYSRERQLNEHLTFKKKDKIPYGTYAAFQHLPYLFPNASVVVNKKSPANFDPVQSGEKGQLFLIISPQFLASEEEMDELIKFAQKGNNVFISTRVLSYQAQDMLHCRTAYAEFAFLNAGSDPSDDTLTVFLNKPPFLHIDAYNFPGKRFDSYFYKYDSSITYELGTNNNGSVNFIRLKTGEGNVYLHLAPITFTNYFLLHKNNMAYYSQALSVIPANARKVIWDEYYLWKIFENTNDNSKNILSVLFHYPPLKWGLLTAIFILVIYMLIEMRRKQRYIPLLSKPANDSLDFVKTIGRLYHDKKDHRNLARKMGTYFLEHVRSKYQLPTNLLDEKFVSALHQKTIYSEKELQEIVSFIHFTENAPAVSENQLATFYQRLKLFYKNS